MATNKFREPAAPSRPWPVIVVAATIMSLALFALWEQLDRPLVLAILVAASAGLGAAIAYAVLQNQTRQTPSASASWHRAEGDSAFAWQDILEAMADPAIIVDGSSTILYYNAAAQAVFDRLRRSIVLERVIRDPELVNAVRDAIEKGERASARLFARGGRERHLIAAVVPLGSKSTLPLSSVLITIRDLSEQHRLLEMRSDFIANASHELRTPVAALRGFIETLQGPARNDEEARKRFLSIMAEQAERMSRLIDDLLLLSRVEEKANLRPTGHVDLDRLLADVVRSLSPIAAERDATIVVNRATKPHFVIGDRDELFQVFQNLIENAVKYGRDHGRVEVTLALEEVASRGSARYRSTTTIRDDGPGIAPEHLPRLTERFYRVNAEHSRKVGGTGLGLAIVKHVLNRHDAELHVESVVGSGTTFRVVIPATLQGQ